jgi:MscS family membrane protein
MDLISNALNKINYSNIPLVKIAIALAILALIQILKKLLVAIVIKNLQRFAAKIKLGLSDEIISILRSSLSYLFLIGGLWTAKEILADNIGMQLNDLLAKTLNAIAIFTISYALYQASSILGKIFANEVLQTGTDLDELLQPLMPKIFQSIALVLIVIKLSELFLGRSATALVGLLGGAGITLGLVFKDILYDWFCTIIIYLDRVFKEGDWVKVAGTSGSSRIVKIGFRTTTLHLLNSGSIVKMPNSKMISGIVENWSQNYNKEVRLGIDITIKLDSISAEKAKLICDEIQELPKTLPGFYSLCRVRFSKIELNLRTIEVLAFVKEEKVYFKSERQLNLAILKILEDAGVSPFYAPLPVVEEDVGV